MADKSPEETPLLINDAGAQEGKSFIRVWHNAAVSQEVEVRAGVPVILRFFHRYSGVRGKTAYAEVKNSENNNYADIPDYFLDFNCGNALGAGY